MSHIDLIARLMDWIEEQGSVPLSAPETDVITYDNNQIIGKTDHISINNECQTNTITTGIHTCISTEAPQIQQVKELLLEFLAPGFHCITGTNGPNEQHAKTGREAVAVWHMRSLKLEG